MPSARSAARSNPLPPTAPAGQAVMLLVARPGLWRNAFESYLRAQPEVVLAAVYGDLSAALDHMRCTPWQTLVLDAAVCDADLSAVAATLKSITPPPNLILIVETLADYQAAQVSYPDRVWLKSLLPQPLDMALFARTPPSPR